MNNSYQEWWRDWPFEARQPITDVIQVLIPAELNVLEDKVKRQKLLLIEGVFFIFERS